MSEYVISFENEGKVEELTRTANVIALFGEGTSQKNVKPLGDMMINEKVALKQSYLDTIVKLRNDYADYLSHVNPNNIMVEVDMVWELTEKTTENSRWSIKIKKTSATEELFTGYEYKLQMKDYWIRKWSDAQFNAAILSQLLRINSEDGSVKNYSESFNSKLISTFGEGYLDEHVSIPDVLQEKIHLKGFQKASQQVTLEDAGEESKVVQMKKVN